MVLHAPLRRQAYQRGGQHAWRQRLIEAVAQLKQGERGRKGAGLQAVVVGVIEQQEVKGRGQQAREQGAGEGFGGVTELRQMQGVRSLSSQTASLRAHTQLFPSSSHSCGDGLG